MLWHCICIISDPHFREVEFFLLEELRGILFVLGCAMRRKLIRFHLESFCLQIIIELANKENGKNPQMSIKLRALLSFHLFEFPFALSYVSFCRRTGGRRVGVAEELSRASVDVKQEFSFGNKTLSSFLRSNLSRPERTFAKLTNSHLNHFTFETETRKRRNFTKTKQESPRENLQK